ncbi:MAG: hypothetical protein KJ638_02265 [Chloroflexi bacterium]|nr:hypothetical protein [Chloroflexota bacterium]
MTDFCFHQPLSDAEQSLLREAAAYLEKSIAFNPQASHSYLLLGRVYCLLDNPTDAVDNYKAYTQLRPGNPLGHLELGFGYEAKGEIELAIAEWEAGGVSGNDFLEAGGQAQESGSYGEALGWYERVATMGTNSDSNWWYAQFLIFKDLSQDLKAYQALSQAIGTDQGWHNPQVRFLAWYQWGVWLHLEHHSIEAESVLRKAIELYPDQAPLKSTLSEAYRFLGLAQWAQDNLKDAVTNLKQAVQVNQENTWAHIHYGKVLYLYDPGLVLETQKEFDSAINLATDKIDIWINLIDFWKWVGEVEQTELLCQQALDYWKSNSQIIAGCTQ